MKNNITKILVSMALACSLLLSGCSREITMSVDQIGSELKGEIDTKNMEVGTDKSLRRYFGINANDLDGYV
jgi:outer membrane murein-binding lipoprotein Lpp